MNTATVRAPAPPAGRASIQKRAGIAQLRFRRAQRPRGTLGGALRTARASAAAGRPAASTPAAQSVDFLVLGSGIAGLSYALNVAEHGRVAIVTKEDAAQGSTQYAQGGVCAVLGANDSVEAHIEDTMVAGDYINSRRCVAHLCNRLIFWPRKRPMCFSLFKQTQAFAVLSQMWLLCLSCSRCRAGSIRSLALCMRDKSACMQQYGRRS